MSEVRDSYQQHTDASDNSENLIIAKGVPNHQHG